MRGVAHLEEPVPSAATGQVWSYVAIAFHPRGHRTLAHHTPCRPLVGSLRALWYPCVHGKPGTPADMSMAGTAWMRAVHPRPDAPSLEVRRRQRCGDEGVSVAKVSNAGAVQRELPPNTVKDDPCLAAWEDSQRRNAPGAIVQPCPHVETVLSKDVESPLVSATHRHRLHLNATGRRRARRPVKRPELLPREHVRAVPLSCPEIAQDVAAS